MSAKLIILDRDGVINYDSNEYIKNDAEWIPLPGSIEAIAQLSQAGFIVCVATNQSGLARGLFTEIDLANMHSLMCDLVEEQGGKIDGIFFCSHGPDDKCKCRKPETGLLDQIEQQFEQSVEGCWFIGDTDKDINAALAKNCQPALVLTGKGLLTKESIATDILNHLPVFDDLFSAATFIIASKT